MTNVLIRNVDEEILDRLKVRAARNDRSLQGELVTILERAARVDITEGRALAARVRRRLAGRIHSDSTALVATDRRR